MQGGALQIARDQLTQTDFVLVSRDETSVPAHKVHEEDVDACNVHLCAICAFERDTMFP